MYEIKRQLYFETTHRLVRFHERQTDTQTDRDRQRERTGRRTRNSRTGLSQMCGTEPHPADNYHVLLYLCRDLLYKSVKTMEALEIITLIVVTSRPEAIIQARLHTVV